MIKNRWWWFHVSDLGRYGSNSGPIVVASVRRWWRIVESSPRDCPRFSGIFKKYFDKSPNFFVKIWILGSPGNQGMLFISMLGNISYSSSPKKLAKALLAIPTWKNLVLNLDHFCIFSTYFKWFNTYFVLFGHFSLWANQKHQQSTIYFS